LLDGVGPFTAILENQEGPITITTEKLSLGSQEWRDNSYAFLTINCRSSILFWREFI